MNSKLVSVRYYGVVEANSIDLGLEIFMLEFGMVCFVAQQVISLQTA
jgi:hypothetical protein